MTQTCHSPRTTSCQTPPAAGSCAGQAGGAAANPGRPPPAAAVRVLGACCPVCTRDGPSGILMSPRHSAQRQGQQLPVREGGPLREARLSLHLGELNVPSSLMCSAPVHRALARAKDSVTCWGHRGGPGPLRAYLPERGQSESRQGHGACEQGGGGGGLASHLPRVRPRRPRCSPVSSCVNVTSHR